MEGTVLEAVLNVFGAIGDWFTVFVPSLFNLFWIEGAPGEPGELTFLGVLAVAGLAFSVVFQNF